MICYSNVVYTSRINKTILLFSTVNNLYETVSFHKLFFFFFFFFLNKRGRLIFCIPSKVVTGVRRLLCGTVCFTTRLPLVQKRNFLRVGIIFFLLFFQWALFSFSFRTFFSSLSFGRNLLYLYLFSGSTSYRYSVQECTAIYSCSMFFLFSTRILNSFPNTVEI